MAFYDKFPYTNFQELNLDRIADRIGDIDESVRISEENKNASETAANEAEKSASSAASSAENAADSAASAQAASGSIPNMQNQINVLSSRVDQFEQLTEGSTTGDAELQDIRVAFNGVTYPTAGDAVRAQAGNLNTSVTQISTDMADISGSVLPVYLVLGSLNTNTGAESDITDGRYLRTNFIPIKESTQYTILTNNPASLATYARVLYYDDTYTFMSATAWSISANTSHNITSPAGAAFIRMRIDGTGMTASSVSITIIKKNALIYSMLYSKPNINAAGLDLNTGDFIHPGMWYLNFLEYRPAHSPTVKRFKIISFATASDNPTSTIQIVHDIDGNLFTRYGRGPDDWTNWIKWTEEKNNTFALTFINPESFMNDYEINRLGSGETERVNKLYALYDAVSGASGVSSTISNLGTDASGTFQIRNYRITKNTGEKPIVLLIFGEHGDELTSAYLGYYLYMEVMNGVLTKYLDYVDFWIVPLMNPYGYENGTRNNYNNVNLNRDFPALWEYSTASHNKTGNYSLSQPETNIIYNLLVNNKDKILFMCNKHDTGGIAKKIATSQPDIVAYTSTLMNSDYIINNGTAQHENMQIRVTDPWIIDDCTVDISAYKLITSEQLATPGSLDVFANSIGIHGSLLEIAGASYYTDDGYQYYPVGQFHYKDLARLGLDYLVNYIIATLHNNERMQRDATVSSQVRYWTRAEESGEWVMKEMYWDGTALVRVD